jgi:hypothetical protein
MNHRGSIRFHDGGVPLFVKSFGVELYLAPDERVPPAGAPTSGYATLGQYAPIAWPSGAAKVPVSGQLSPHAAAALKRMGITKD